VKKNKKSIYETHQKLIDEEWDYEKNNKLGLDPSKITYGSHKKAWWKCENKHNWNAQCTNRTIGKTGCPYCSGRIARNDNCLLTKNPELAKEMHPIKNGEINAQNIAYKSGKKVWWKCKKGHEWKTSPLGRCNGKSNCPYCGGKKICEDNCLSTTHPELAKEMHPTKNGSLTPHDIRFGSHKKIWWICKKGHEYQSAICERSTKRNYKYGCPYCSGKKLCKDNCLLFTHPDISKEWDYTNNKNLTPTDISRSCRKKVWWKCKEGHQWQACVSSRSRHKSKCPTCHTINTSGKNHYNYNPNLTDEDRINKRFTPEYNNWKENVFKKNNYICQICNNRGGDLNAHHLMGYNKYIELRFNLDNGITLCETCHDNFHHIYGRGDNTLQQFEEHIININNKLPILPIS
jgi:hypothetical protein